MTDRIILPKPQQFDNMMSKVPKHVKLSNELVEAEVEFKMALMGVAPRKNRLKIRDKEIEMSNHPENSTLEIKSFLS
jgi:hypothetical protein